LVNAFIGASIKSEQSLIPSRPGTQAYQILTAIKCIYLLASLCFGQKLFYKYVHNTVDPGLWSVGDNEFDFKKKLRTQAL
jgi:hypothetical protein